VGLKIKPKLFKRFERQTECIDISGNQIDMRKGKIPITILCGFLGSGNTTLLNRILENNKGRRIGVIVEKVHEVMPPIRDVYGDL